MKVLSSPLANESQKIVNLIHQSSEDALAPLATSFLSKIWAVTEKGDNLPVGPQSNAEVWRHFHRMRQCEDLRRDWDDFVHASEVSHFTSNLVLQEVLTLLVRTILKLRNKSQEETTTTQSNVETEYS